METMEGVRGILIGFNSHCVLTDVLVRARSKCTCICICVIIGVKSSARGAHLEERIGRRDAYTVAATVLIIHRFHVIALIL